MPRLVTQFDIDLANPTSLSVSGTASIASRTRLGAPRRTSFSLVSLTSGVTLTIIKGDIEGATVNNGITLQQNQAYVESDADNFNCWQGQITLIASGAGTVAFTEVIDNSNDGA